MTGPGLIALVNRPLLQRGKPVEILALAGGQSY